MKTPNSREGDKSESQKPLPPDQQVVDVELTEDWKEWPHSLKWMVEWRAEHRI